MKIKIKKYNKWYDSKKLQNCVNVSISEIADKKDYAKLYQVFNVVIKSDNVLLDFGSRHEFDNEKTVSANIDSVTNYIISNGGNLEINNKLNTFWLGGTAQIKKGKINDDVFKNICNAFEGITFYGSSSQLDYNNLKQLLESNKNIYTYEYLVNNEFVDVAFTFSNDGLFAGTRINSSKVNLEELLNKIKTIIEKSASALFSMKLRVLFVYHNIRFKNDNKKVL